MFEVVGRAGSVCLVPCTQLGVHLVFRRHKKSWMLHFSPSPNAESAEQSGVLRATTSADRVYHGFKSSIDTLQQKLARS